MNKINDILQIIDASLKATVLLIFTVAIVAYGYYCTVTGKVPNLPDWQVSIATIVYLYFFRRALKKEKTDV